MALPDSKDLIVVKNTFIDLDDEPRKPILARYASMPAKFAHDEEAKVKVKARS